jgi:hypothetical protein
MNRLPLFFLYLFLAAIPVRAQSPSYHPKHLYPPGQLKADLAVLKQKLTAIHPALYRYWSKAAFSAFCDSLDHTLTHPLNEQEFLSLITLMEGRIGDGHTMILPSEQAVEYLHTRARQLPLSLTDSAGHLLIRENNSAEDELRPDDEIVSINGIKTPVLLAALLDRRTRDGYNATYPVWQLNQYFPAYYSFTFGEPPVFTLDVRSRDGYIRTRRIAALTRDSIAAIRKLRYPGLAAQKPIGQGITLKEGKEEHAATLTIKSFDPDILRDTYRQVFEHVIDSVFTQLDLHHTEHLTLDLRDNQGGDFEQGRYLLSWLSSKPCQYLLGGPEARLIQPKPHSFTGELNVLVNGGSFSNTVIVCATLQKEGRATFSGEETGGNKRIISGNPKEFILPFTKIRCYISTADFRITEGVNDGHGLLPNVPAGQMQPSAPVHSS